MWKKILISLALMIISIIGIGLIYGNRIEKDNKENIVKIAKK